MRIPALVVCSAMILAAAPPWYRKDARDWSNQEVERMLSDSPWAQPATAAVLAGKDQYREPVGPPPGAAQAGMAGSRGSGSGGSGSGSWDGSVARDTTAGSLPSVPLVIRWDSALPIKEAFTKSGRDHEDIDGEAARNYVIAIIGLVPAGQYTSGGSLSTHSQSDDRNSLAGVKQDPEQMLEGLMGSSRLLIKHRNAIAPDNVKLDAKSGNLHIFFPRTTSISEADKDVVFVTRFGPLTIEKRFRLRDMQYKGRLEL